MPRTIATDSNRGRLKLGQDRFGRVDGVAHGGTRGRRGWQVDVDARAEAYETIALAARKTVSRPDVAEDAPRDQAGHLHAGDVDTRLGAQVYRVALVVERRLVERRIDEAAGVIPHIHDVTVHRAAVRVDVEDVHEDADT